MGVSQYQPRLRMRAWSWNCVAIYDLGGLAMWVRSFPGDFSPCRRPGCRPVFYIIKIYLVKWNFACPLGRLFLECRDKLPQPLPHLTFDPPTGSARPAGAY